MGLYRVQFPGFGGVARAHMPAWFNVRKAAQIAAFFADSHGGRINVLKLAKLIYIADRTNMQQYDFPISGDKLVSMDHGPVNSITLDYIKGFAKEDAAAWSEFMTDLAGYEVGLSRPITEADLDELSEAELGTLKAVWHDFGHMTKYELRDWTHDNCPEWEDPDGSSYPIPYERVFKFLGKTHAEELAKRVEEERRLRATLAHA
jgi:uncharacterized phage-associated protein